MQLIVLWEGIEDPIVIFVPDDADLALFAQLLMAETGKRLEAHNLIEFEGQQVTGGHPLVYQGIVDGSTLFVKGAPKVSAVHPASPVRPQQPLAQQSPAPAPVQSVPTPQPNRNVTLYDIPADVTPEQLMELSNANPNLLRQVQANDTELGQVLASRDIGALRILMMKRFMDRHKQEFQKQQELLEYERDPMNPEYQKKIEEEVRASPK